MHPRQPLGCFDYIQPSASLEELAASTGKRGDDAPSDQNAGDPNAGAHLLQEKIAGVLRKESSQNIFFNASPYCAVVIAKASFIVNDEKLMLIRSR